MTIAMYDVLQDDMQHPILTCETTAEYSADSLSTPGAVTDMLIEVFQADKKPEEHMYMVAINAANEVMGAFDVSHGTLLSTCADARCIYTRGMLTGAAGIILAHNHPSGCLRASNDDLRTCESLRDAGSIMGIKLIDFIIIGKNHGYMSFAREGTGGL